MSIDTEAGGPAPSGLYRNDLPATAVRDIESVSAGHLEQYRDQGFLAVEAALDRDRVSGALAALESIVLDPRGANISFETWAAERLPELDGAARLDAVRKFMGFADKDPRLEAIARDERILSVVRRIVGSEDLVLWQDMALLKPPGGGREKPWHQDNAYFAIAPGTPIVGVWIALDPATPENGCMHVIPGSHREGPVVHFRRRDWQICDTDVQRWRDVVVPLPRGGLMFFDGLIHHGTPTNHTDQRRRAVQFHYVAASTVTTSDEERLRIFGSEGKGVTC